MQTHSEKSSASNISSTTKIFSNKFSLWLYLWTRPRVAIRYIQNAYSLECALGWALSTTTFAMVLMVWALRDRWDALPDDLMMRSLILASFALIGSPLYAFHLCGLGTAANFLGSPVKKRDLMYAFMVYSFGYAVFSLVFVLLERVTPGFLTNIFRPSVTLLNLAARLAFLMLFAWFSMVYFLCLSELLGLSKTRTLGAFMLSSCIALMLVWPIAAMLVKT